MRCVALRTPARVPDPAARLHLAIAGLQTPPRPGSVGKAILFAAATLAFPGRGPWSEAPVDAGLPAFADVPPAGEVIPAGRPICTLLARGNDPAQCLAALRLRADHLARVLDWKAADPQSEPRARATGRSGKELAQTFGRSRQLAAFAGNPLQCGRSLNQPGRTEFSGGIACLPPAVVASFCWVPPAPSAPTASTSSPPRRPPPGRRPQRPLALGRALSSRPSRFRPRWVTVTDPDACRASSTRGLPPARRNCCSARTASPRWSSDPDVDVVVTAIVGAAGLAGTWAALEAGKTVAVANKETLVMAGPLVMELAARARRQRPARRQRAQRHLPGACRAAGPTKSSASC